MNSFDLIRLASIRAAGLTRQLLVFSHKQLVQLYVIDPTSLCCQEPISPGPTTIGHSFAGAEGLFKHRAPTCAFKQIPPVKENLFKAGVGQFMGNLFDILGVALIMSDRSDEIRSSPSFT